MNVVPDTHDWGKGKFRIQLTVFPRATDRKGMRKFHGSYASKIEAENDLLCVRKS